MTTKKKCSFVAREIWNLSSVPLGRMKKAHGNFGPRAFNYELVTTCTAGKCPMPDGKPAVDPFP
jgi:hypothetical protein